MPGRSWAAAVRLSDKRHPPDTAFSAVALLCGCFRRAGQAERITDGSRLPGGDFEVETLDWVGMNVEPQDLERLSGLRALRRLYLPGPIWNRNADSGRDGSRDFKFLAPIERLEVITFSYRFLAGTGRGALKALK